jgi:CRP/FNR family nitrogen fixation transcriptional regulator
MIAILHEIATSALAEKELRRNALLHVDGQEREPHNVWQIVRCVRETAVVARVSGSETAKPVPSQPNKLARKDDFWSELKIRSGSKLFGEAEPAEFVYQIREGAVRTYKRLSDGRRQIGAFHLPGDILVVENCEIHRFTAEAIVNTTVWVTKRRSLFAGLAEGDISTANKVRELVTRTLERAENHLLLLGRQNSVERVAAFLFEMDRRLEQPKVMILPMGRRDIADYLGTTVETVCRALSTLRDEGILSIGRGLMQREIVLHDRSKLVERVCQPDPERRWRCPFPS